MRYTPVIRPEITDAVGKPGRTKIRAKGPGGAVFTVRLPVSGTGLPSVHGVAP